MSVSFPAVPPAVPGCNQLSLKRRGFRGALPGVEIRVLVPSASGVETPPPMPDAGTGGFPSLADLRHLQMDDI